MTKEEVNKVIAKGERAEIAKEVLNDIAEEIICDCKECFVNSPLIYNQSIDKCDVFMLQLKIIAVRAIQDIMNKRILEMQNAKNEMRRI